MGGFRHQNIETFDVVGIMRNKLPFGWISPANPSQISQKPFPKRKFIPTLKHRPNCIIFQWVANPVTDMYADAVMTVILRAETDPMPQKSKLFTIMVFIQL